MADSDWTVNPGDPSQTDEEDTRAADVDAAADTSVDPDADAAVDDALSGDASAANAAAADAAADEVHETGTPEENSEAAQAAEESSLAAQLEERTDDLKRVSAEYANFRRRVERDRGAVIGGAKAEIVSQLLPILDDLELAEQHGDLTGGLKAVADKLRSAVAGTKTESFGAEGEEFDPALHEAVQDSSTGDVKVIGTVLRRGYRLGDRILRNALVIISDPLEQQGEES